MSHFGHPLLVINKHT